MKAAVTFTLVSSAPALSNLRSARQRELPTTVNGHLAIEDTCNQYQTKDDCCVEVNCLFEADACKPRADAAQNGECDASRGAPTNGKNDATKFNSGAESAQKQMLGSLGTGEVQAKAAGARSPPCPWSQPVKALVSLAHFPCQANRLLRCWIQTGGYPRAASSVLLRRVPPS